MADIKKIEKFCDSLMSQRMYPNSLLELRRLSEKTKKVLLKVIRQYQNKNDKDDRGYIETELIKRFLSYSPFLNKKFKKIQGPVSIRCMSSDEYPQIFYLLGDTHTRKSTCTKEHTVSKWIYSTIINSPVFIDVYLETPYMYKDYIHLEKGIFKSKTDKYIRDVNILFSKCFFNESDAVCQTTRFHYTDMRAIFETKEQEKGRKIFRKILKNKATKEDMKDLRYINNWLAFLRDPNSIIYTRIEKQMDNILNINIQKYLRKSYQDCLKSGSHFLDNVNLTEIKTNKKATERIPVHEINTYRICLMDYYLMARCFRSYHRKSSEYYRPSYNNIIYAGDRHVKNYADILEKLGFKTTYKNISRTKKSNYQCVDISLMEQPMFHQRYR